MMIIITLQCTGDRPATKNYPTLYVNKGFPGGSDGKESTCNVGDLGSIPGLGRSPRGGHGNLVQYSFLENPHGQRGLAGFSTWGCKELNMTERLNTAQHPLSPGAPTHYHPTSRSSQNVTLRSLCYTTASH